MFILEKKNFEINLETLMHYYISSLLVVEHLYIRSQCVAMAWSSFFIQVYTGVPQGSFRSHFIFYLK